MTDAEELRAALAAGPTPGPWQAANDAPNRRWQVNAEDFGVATCDGAWKRIPADAAYIAAASPDRIARLLDALEAATRDAARYRWLRDDPPLSLAVRRFPGETERGCYLDGVCLDEAIDAAMKAAHD